MRLVTTQIPGGDAGTLATANAMRDLVNSALASPVVLRWAHTITEGAVEPEDQVRAIATWLREHFIFTPDPREVEGVRVYDLLAHPLAHREMYERSGAIYGDCDDAATLSAALGKAARRPAKFRLVGFTGPTGPFTHVYTLLRIPRQWVRLDITHPLDLATPAPSRVLEVSV